MSVHEWIKGELRVQHILDCLAQGRPLSTIKLCHGFWEQCVRFERTRQALQLEPPLDNTQWGEIIARHSVNWPLELFLETRTLTDTASDFPNLLTLVSPYGWSGAYEIEGTPIEGLAAVLARIDEWFPPGLPRYDGLLWKNAVQDGSFSDFIFALRDEPVLVVGPAHTGTFMEFAGFRHAAFLEVDEFRAAWHRHATLDAIGNRFNSLAQAGLVCLIQAGGLNSTWLVYELARRYPQVSCFALGQVLNLASPERLRRLNWYTVHRRSIVKTLERINPDWLASDAGAQPGGGWAENYEPGLRALVRQVPDSIRAAQDGPADFIENKAIDLHLVNRLLAHSRAGNHWANFGPVTRLLEQGLERLLGIPAEQRVVSCKSATDATLTLIDLHAFRRGRPLRWVVSAFGFFSTHIAQLAESIIVDCDSRGLLSLDALEKLSLDAWDGVIITNPFGLAGDLSPVVDFARRHGKAVIVDNAAALFTKCRKLSAPIDEVISFHHTKPWGIGEGGVAIIAAEDAETFRALVNFGVGLDPEARRYSRNSKLDDYSAALILQRLVNLPNWRPLYGMQLRRIRSIAEPLGYRTLGPIPPDALLGHVPLLAPVAVPKARIQNAVLTLRKYYVPLAGGFAQAQDIYDHIVCVPCHPQVSQCGTEPVRDLLAGLLH